MSKALFTWLKAMREQLDELELCLSLPDLVPQMQ
jgi:hypothetical protein